MKRVIRFSKLFLPATIFSVALIGLGIMGLVVNGGFNLGVDFQAGVNQYVRFAYPSLEVSYAGPLAVSLEITETRATVVYSGTEGENRTLELAMSDFGTIDEFAAALAADGLGARVLDGGSLPASLVVPTYRGAQRLGPAPTLVTRGARDANEVFTDTEMVRAAVEPIGELAVKSIGGDLAQEYVIRVSDDGTDPGFGGKITERIRTALESSFDPARVVFMKTDLVGATFSKDLTDNAWLMTLMTIGAILLYAAIRFKLQYGIGAVLAIIHDALVMIGFMAWTRMEFNTSSIAAILTILGFSINDTIVIFDRIREDRKLRPTERYVDILDEAITETLSRTFITAFTTMLAILALVFFTTGSIKDFAVALVVGMISGAYSTIYIATAFVKIWDDLKTRRALAAAKAAPAPAHKVKASK